MRNNQSVSGNLLLKTISRMRINIQEGFFFLMYVIVYSYSTVSMGSYQ
jgi:hypothetical protein